ncbi:MAG: hypothetical protein E7380_00845 [Clostridiales bacterium]|nr:hypothetical protein [Clostridiales bacterium]
MQQKSKSLWIKLLLVLTIVCCVFGVWLSLPAFSKEKIAKAETTDVTETIDLQFKEGYSNMTAGADYSSGYTGKDDICLVGYVGNEVLLANSVLSTGQCWVASASKANPTNNGGVDIMEYIYINGSSVKELSAANASNNVYAGTHWELGQGGKRAPALVETSDSSGLLIRICMAYSNAGEFEIVIKEGFQLLTADGNTVTVSEDVTFKYKDKAISKVVEGTDVTDAVEIIGANHSAAQSLIKIDLKPAAALTSNAWWNINGSSLIAANNGVDIMNYIYVNGQNIRTLSDDNRTNNTYPVGDATGWLGNSDQCRPAFVETNGDGIWVTVLHAFSGEEYTVTLKAGFAILDVNGNVLTISEDVDFLVNAGGATRIQEYTLSFEGLTDTKTVIGGAAIGELPAVPEKDGFVAIGWAIDGVAISEATVYNYGVNKTATPVYQKEIVKTDVTETVSIKGASHSAAQSLIKIDLKPAAALASDAWWNIKGANLIAANNGVDIMEYIYINGEELRALSDDNRENNTYPLGSASGWLANSDQCRPVFVETNGDGIWLTVLHAFSGEEYTVTLKAGFAILDVNGNVLTISEDVDFLVNAGGATRIQEYTLSFEGLDDTKIVIGGTAIGELPAVPDKDGFVAIGWAIDGVAISAATVYNYGANKTAAPVYQKQLVINDVTDTVEIKGGSYKETQSQFKIELAPSSALTTNAWWNIYGSSLITANNGVDIMEYIYINGEEIRALSDDNRENNTYPLGSAGGWLGNSDQCRPVFVETTADGIYVTVLHAFSNTSYVITLKAGFAILNAEGGVSVITEDIHFKYTEEKTWRLTTYTLAFEGFDSKTVFDGEAIGQLPVLEEREGFIGEWKIDGVVITADTVYDYGENKTAVAEYRVKLPTHTLSFECAEGEFEAITIEEGMPLSNLPALPTKALHTGAWTIDGEVITADTVYSYEEDKTAVAVYTPIETVDITSRVTIEDRDWAVEVDDHTALGVLVDGEYLKAREDLRKYWNNNGATLSVLNHGCDIMKYIYINGVSARSIVTKNDNDETTYTGQTFPFSAGGVYSPIAVEATNSGGLWIKILKEFAGDSYTVTLKKGFVLINADDEVLVLSGDVAFEFVRETQEDGKVKCTINKSVQKYGLSFEGETSIDPISVAAGGKLGSLPAVPERVGYTGVWTIDGVKVNADSVYAYGEDKTAVAVYTPVEYTITIERANGETETIIFTVENAESKLAEVVLTESNEEYAYEWSETLPESLEAKNYTFTEIEIDLIPDTRIISQSLSIGTSFAMNIYVEVVDENIPIVRFAMQERVVDVEGELVDETAGKYVYTFAGIAAHDLATVFTVSVLVGDTEIDFMTYSVEAYLNALSKKEISDELKTLVADIVAYGQAAEAYVGKTDGIATIEGLVGTVYNDLVETDYKKSEPSNSQTEITMVKLAYTDVNRLTVRFTAASIDNLSVKINGNEVSFFEVEEGSGIYEATTKEIYLTGCDDRFKVTLCVQEKVVQTLIYSVKSYVYEKQGTTDEAEVNYVKALYNCSLALKAYAEGV